MGRRSSEEPGLGLEFFGLGEAAAPAARPVAAPVADGAPLTRREARERENAAARPIVYTAERIATPVHSVPVPSVPTPSAPVHSVPVVLEPLQLAAGATRRGPAERQSPAPARGRAAASRRSRAVRRKPRAASKALSLAAMLFAGALVVGMSVPANALMTGTPVAAASSPKLSTIGDQTVNVSADAADATPARDSFSVIDYAELTREEYGTQNFTYTVTTGAVRWPFPYASPISDGYGPRDAPCDGCSTFHEGVDFTPGAGTPIFAIADGVVSTHEDDYGSFGNHVVISHVINGQHVDSLYAHMQTGSSALVPGQVVKVGDLVGLVGSTGESTGAHLHFEIHLDGVPVDPFAWLQANAVN